MKEYYGIDEVECDELKEIVLRISREYNLFPGFMIRIDSPRSAWYNSWGTIIISEYPKNGVLCSLDRYLLLLGLGYHAVLPATELNRLIMLAAARKVFRNVSKQIHGFMVSLMSIFSIFTQFSKCENLKVLVEESLSGILKQKSAHYSPLGRIVQEFFESLLGAEPSEKTKRLIKIVSLNVPLYIKAKMFFSELLPKLELLDPWSFHERNLRKYVIPISPDEVVDGAEGPSIEPHELELLGEIDYKFAKEVASKLDAKMDSSGKEPAFSENKTMIQKLLSKRRYLAAARRARIRRLLSIIETRMLLVEPRATKYGFSEWHLGDDEEKLNIEISSDTYGRVIPEISTLRDIYELGEENLSEKGAIRHIELCIDTSGSMSGEALERAIDLGVALVEIAKKSRMSVGVSTFSSGAWEGSPPTFDYDLIEELLLRLDSGGGTNIRHVFELIENHIGKLFEKALVAIITDTAIYDILFPEVISNLMDLKEKAYPVIFAITSELWKKAEVALGLLRIPVIYVPPDTLGEGGISIIIDEITKLCTGT